MFSLLLAATPESEDELIADLWECGTAGIVEEAGGLRAFFDDPASAESLRTRFASFHPTFRAEPDTCWEQVSRDAWPPLPIGNRFYLAPSWRREATPPGRIRLAIDPGMACGTGWHPCTRMCLEAMEDSVRPGAAFLDVGCGSGILSLAASLLGAGRVAACDIDGDAARIAREHFHDVLFVGSADSVRTAWADVVAVNIGSAAIEELLPDLLRARKPGGALILSGFEESDLPDTGLPVLRRLHRDGWACLVS